MHITMVILFVEGKKFSRQSGLDHLVLYSFDAMKFQKLIKTPKKYISLNSYQILNSQIALHNNNNYIFWWMMKYLRVFSSRQPSDILFEPNLYLFLLQNYHREY